jgi:hypothetical protein
MSSSSFALLLLVLVVLSSAFQRTVATSREYSELARLRAASLGWGEGAAAADGVHRSRSKCHHTCMQRFSPVQTGGRDAFLSTG